MKFIATTSDKISSIKITANQMIFSRDDRVIYLDATDTERTVYNTIITLADETARISIAHPVKAFYFVEDTNVLFRYDGSQWQQLTTPPQESLIFINKEDFPIIGKEKTLYVDEERIYQWSNEKNDYINMSGGNAELV